MEKAKLYLKKYGWILLAVTIGLLGTFIWLVANAGKRKKPVRPASLDTPLPDRVPDFKDPEEPTIPEVELAPLTRYLNNARRVDEQIKSRKDADRIKEANERYR